MMLAFDHAEIEEGPMGFMVEDRHLRPALLAAMDNAGITQIEDRVIAQSPDAAGISVALASGSKLRARLLIGCDGNCTPQALQNTG